MVSLYKNIALHNGIKSGVDSAWQECNSSMMNLVLCNN